MEGREDSNDYCGRKKKKKKAKENLNLQAILIKITVFSVNICSVCLMKYSLQQNEVTKSEERGLQIRRAGS